MRFIWNLVVSRMRREKKRLFFVALAIAASSCLVVWTIGGFQALFIDETTREANYLGDYDLRIGANMTTARRGGGGTFTGPTSRKFYGQTAPAPKSDGSGAKTDESPRGDDAASERRAPGEERSARENAEPTEGRGSGRGPRGGGMGDGVASERRAPGEERSARENAEPTEGRGSGRGPRGGGMGDGVASERRALGEERSARENAEPTEGRGSGRGSRGGGMGGGGNRPAGRGGFPSASAIPDDLIAALRRDDDVSVCDEISTLRMYVYTMGSEKSILEDDDDPEDQKDRPTVKRSLEVDDEQIGAAPEGVDPEMHRRAFAAYRATMGTPMGMGSVFWTTTAKEAPFELEDGRWFRSEPENGLIPREAVMSIEGAKRYNAKVGDPLILIATPTLTSRAAEFQLTVVGIVDDPELEGFYVSNALGRELAQAAASPFAPTALYLKLRGSVAEFREKREKEILRAAPTMELVTREDLIERRMKAFKQEQSFKFQAASGALLASLASILIVFTALNMSVEDMRRLIAFYRVSGLTRSQVAISILIEGTILAIPGWIAGVIAGWALVFVISGKPTGINWQTVGFSFLCAVVGALVASLAPMIQSARVKPLEAFGVRVDVRPYLQTRKRQTKALVAFALVGAALIVGDATLIRFSSIDTAERAAIHSGAGLLALAVGVAALIPLAIRVVEAALIPLTAFLLRLDSTLLRRDLSGNAGRVFAVAIALSVGGGLFVTMQIWGYSMLQPFLPGRRAPDAFAAFLPNGLRPEMIEELKGEPFVDPARFLPVAVEQAAFAEGSVPDNPSKNPFANVVFFGVDVAKAFEGETPLIGMYFRQGDPEEAWISMKSGRGVVVTDSLSVDYHLNLGDSLKVAHPREPGRTLEYPIVGVVAFDGWQWLSKTGGVRRNFGRSGGLVFAREGVIANDYDIERRSYFWFDQPGGAPVDYATTEAACDRIAVKNLKLDLAERGETERTAASQTAYVKLSTRESLTSSITRRADNVIWGLSKTPLTTLAIAAIAVVGAVSNSVRSRRWQFGVERALGMTRGALVRMIVVEGLVIGTVAATASFLFGFLAAQGALKLGRSMFGTQDPPLILPTEGLLIGLALTLVLCVAAALYPAITTGRTEPLKLLKSGRTPD